MSDWRKELNKAKELLKNVDEAKCSAMDRATAEAFINVSERILSIENRLDKLEKEDA